jgi:hypothetical protein
VDAMRHQYVADQCALLIHHQIALREQRINTDKTDSNDGLANVDYFRRLEDLWQGKSNFTAEEASLLQQFQEASQKVFSIEELKPSHLLAKTGLPISLLPVINGGNNE